MPRQSIPFVRDRYEPDTRRISDLLRYAGASQADYELQRGQIAANLGSNLAHLAGSTMSGLLEYAAGKPRREAEALALQARKDEIGRAQAVSDAIAKTPLDEMTGRPNAQRIAEEVMRIDPEKALAWWAAADEQQKAQLLTEKMRTEDLARRLASFEVTAKKLAPPARQELWTKERMDAIESGVATPEQVPEQYSPAFVKRTLNQVLPIADVMKQLDEVLPKTRQVEVQNPDGTKTIKIVEDAPGQEFTSAAEPPKPAEPYTLSPGAQRFGPDNKPVASVPFAPREERTPTYQRIETVDAAGNPVIQFLTAEEVRAQGGVKTSPKTTAKASGPATVQAIMDEIDMLSKKINTGEGLGATMGGMARRGMAAANYDNEVAEYEALVKGFIPMVARAVGHTGVLTQQDVDSVRALFPLATDNAQLAKNKIERVRKLMSAIQEPSAPGAAPKVPDPLGIRPGGGR